jgi:hypothetical protein
VIARTAGIAAALYLLASASTGAAPVDAPVGQPLEVLRQPYLLGSWTQLYQVYPSRVIPRAGPVRPLARARNPLGPVSYEFEGTRRTLEEYFERNGVTSFLVIKDGRIVHETYRLGTDEHTLFVSWSMAKSVTSTLLGLMVADGKIASLDDPAVKYVPQLAQSGYGDASLRDLLQMTSGVKFVEDYYAQDSPEGRAWVEGVVERKLPYNETTLWFDERIHPPGTRFYYASLEPQVVGWVLREVAGEPLASIFSRRVWQKIGAEHDASWMLDRPGGMEVASCCINATLRDYGRLGQLFLDEGRVGNVQVLPAEWVRAATRPDPDRPFLHPGQLEGRHGLGYQHYWWLWPEDGAYSARGHGGQWLYVNPRQRVVIVQTAVYDKSLPGKDFAETVAAFPAIVRALRD